MKRWMKAGIISLAVTLCGMLANIISWYSSGHLLLAKTMYGGEIIEEFGFGIMAAHIYSMEPNGKGSVFMHFDPFTFVISLVLFFLLAFAVLAVIELQQAKKTGMEV